MNPPIRRPVVALAATALSATLFHFGTGLTPVPWVTWLAPLPVLVLAHRAGCPHRVRRGVGRVARR